MKRIIELVKANPKATAILVASVLLGVALIVGLPRAASMINEHRITQLEAEKQKALKDGQAAREQNLILQGQLKAKDEQIADLTSQIAESNQRVSNAHTETQSARQNLNQVRAAAPHFNSSDDAGRVRELGSDLQRLYSDTP